MMPFPRQVGRIADSSHQHFLYIVAASLICFFAWANFTVLDKVKRGGGKVVPQMNNQIVQHFEGGIVSEILVREGDRVTKGLPMMRIDNSFAQAELQRARLDIRAQTIRLARLDAEAKELAGFVISGDLPSNLYNILRSETEVFNSRRRTLTQQVAVVEEQSKQKQLELAELKSRYSNTSAERELVLRRVTSLRRLAATGAVSNNELLDNERVLQQIEGRMSDLVHEIPRAESSLVELQSKRGQITSAFRADAEKEKLDAEIQIAKLNETIVALQDRSVRSEVLAPTSGIANKLFVTTIGGVVKSGDPLAQIVPIDTSIAVEARLAPTDRAEVWPGLPAVVKISAYDYSVFGGLKGKVVDISPDVLQDEKGQPYFRVRLEASSSNFGPDRPVVPGMIADVDIIAGQQSVMSSLLRPLRNLRDNALRQ
ncbi:MAG: HlyD family type I secretion periplasmic adaptor subunit [Hyphomicrobiaceae bacterium]